MTLTPALVALGPRLAGRGRQVVPEEDFADAHGSVLVIGFGRFGQFVSQMFLAAGHPLVVIDNDVHRVVDVVREGFPDVPLFVRSWDRRHSIRLLERNVDFELRETLEPALAFGREGLVRRGVGPEEAAAIERDLRTRDAERLAIQRVEGIQAGDDRYRVVPEPLTRPRRAAMVRDVAGG